MGKICTCFCTRRHNPGLATQPSGQSAHVRPCLRVSSFRCSQSTWWEFSGMTTVGRPPDPTVRRSAGRSWTCCFSAPSHPGRRSFPWSGTTPTGPTPSSQVRKSQRAQDSGTPLSQLCEASGGGENALHACPRTTITLQLLELSPEPSSGEVVLRGQTGARLQLALVWQLKA